MSINSIIAFNSAINQMKQNQQDQESLQQAKQKTDQQAQELDIAKRTAESKIKLANSTNQVGDYQANIQLDNLKEIHSAAKQGLDAQSDAQALTEHKLDQANQQAAQLAQTHAQDPDVQNWMKGMMSGGTTQSNGDGIVPPVTPTPAPNAALSAINPLTSKSPQSPNPSVLSSSLMPNLRGTPGVATPQATPSPENVSDQAQPSSATVDTPAPAQNSIPMQTGVLGQRARAYEKTMGMPAGSMMIDIDGKPKDNPYFKVATDKALQAKATYDQNQPFREEQREDKNVRTASLLMANAVKTGPIGVQNGKVDQAIHARELINSSYDPNTGDFNVTQVPYGELGETLSSLLAGKTGSSDARVAAVKQKTAQGDLNTFISYWTGKPSNATSQDAIKQVVDIIDRQGLVSEKERNDGLDQLKKLPLFGRLNDDDFESIKELNLGNSFQKKLDSSPDKQGKKSTESVNPYEAEMRKRGLLK